MTTFVELRDLVYGLTKRPELAGLTALAIRQATLRAHQVDFFQRDARNAVLTYTPPVASELFVTIPNIYSLAARLRTPDFLQGQDVLTLLPHENLEYVNSYKEFWDEYNELRCSRFTLQGEDLLVRFAGATGRAVLYYYVNPVVTDAGYSSWIADEYPEEVAQWAAAIVWNRSGFQEIAQTTMNGIVIPFQAMLVESHLTRKI